MIYVVGGAVYNLPDYSSSSDKPIVNDNRKEPISYYCTISDFILYLDSEIQTCNLWLQHSSKSSLYKLKLKELKRLRSFYLKYLKDIFKKK